MNHARRDYHGVALVCNKIFVAGGRSSAYEGVRKCEKFDLQKEVWTEIPNADVDEFVYSMTLTTIKNRWMIAVGVNGLMNAQRFYLMDCLKVNKGWETLHLTGY